MEILEMFQSEDTRHPGSLESIALQYTRHLRLSQVKNIEVRDLDELLHLQEVVHDRIEELLRVVYETDNPGHWYTYAYEV